MTRFSITQYFSNLSVPYELDLRKILVKVLRFLRLIFLDHVLDLLGSFDLRLSC